MASAAGRRADDDWQLHDPEVASRAGQALDVRSADSYQSAGGADAIDHPWPHCAQTHDGGSHARALIGTTSGDAHFGQRGLSEDGGFHTEVRQTLPHRWLSNCRNVYHAAPSTRPQNIPGGLSAKLQPFRRAFQRSAAPPHVGPEVADLRDAIGHVTHRERAGLNLPALDFVPCAWR